MVQKIAQQVKNVQKKGRTKGKKPSRKRYGTFLVDKPLCRTLGADGTALFWVAITI